MQLFPARCSLLSARCSLLSARCSLPSPFQSDWRGLSFCGVNSAMDSAQTLRELGMEARRAVVRHDLDRGRHLVAALAEHSEPSAQGWVAYLEGNIARLNDQFDDAEAYFRRSHEHFTHADDAGGLAYAMIGLGWLARHYARRDEAHHLYSTALNLAVQAEIQHAQALAHTGFATLYGDMLQIDDAMRHANMALAIMDELGETYEYATIESDKAVILLNMDPLSSDVADHLTIARQHLEHALSVFIDHGVEHQIGTATCQIGFLSFAVHEYDEALRYIHKGLAILQGAAEKNPSYTGILSDIGIAHAMIGEIHMTARNLDAAREYIQRAIDTFERTGQFRSFLHHTLGIIAAWSGQHEEALASYRIALAALREQGHPHRISHVLLNIAHCQLLMNDVEGARASLAESASYPGHGTRSDTWRMVVTAKCLLAEGRPKEAHETIIPILSTVEDDTLKWERVEAEIVLRDIAFAQNDLAEYVRHNDLVTRLTEELRGSKTQQSLALMEQEKEVEAERQRTHQERERERAVLYSALPKSVADRVIRGEKVNDDHFDDAAVLFLDIAGFTRLSSTVPPGHVIHLLDAIFNACDDIVDRHNVTKIKTIGDSYMAVAFPEEGQPPTAERAAAAALDLLDAMDSLQVTMPEDLGDTSWIDAIPRIDVRIGLHIGPVVAGVIGSKRLQYDVWGDTVNTASRMESTGEPGKIQCSEAFVGSLTSFRDDARHPEERSDEGPLFDLRERGTVEVKGKGTMTTYWLERG